MKKVLYILIIIVLLFVLSGCNKYRYNKFNENLEFDEELSGEEYADLIKKVVEKWKDFSKIKMKYNTEQSLDEIKIETTATFKAYSNSIIQLIGHTKHEQTKNSVKTKHNYDTEVYYWDCKEENMIVVKSMVDGELKYESSNYKPTYDNPFDSAYMNIITELQQLTGNLIQTKAYKTKNGYVLIKSDKNEKNDSILNVKQNTTYMNQIIYIVNKEYQVKEILYYTANIVDTSYEYDSSSQTKTTKDSIAIQFKISYGRKQKNLKLEDKLNKEYKEYLNNNRPL